MNLSKNSDFLQLVGRVTFVRALGLRGWWDRSERFHFRKKVIFVLKVVYLSIAFCKKHANVFLQSMLNPLYLFMKVYCYKHYFGFS